MSLTKGEKEDWKAVGTESDAAFMCIAFINKADCGDTWDWYSCGMFSENRLDGESTGKTFPYFTPIASLVCLAHDSCHTSASPNLTHRPNHWKSLEQVSLDLDFGVSWEERRDTFINAWQKCNSVMKHTAKSCINNFSHTVVAVYHAVNSFNWWSFFSLWFASTAWVIISLIDLLLFVPSSSYSRLKRDSVNLHPFFSQLDLLF